MSLPCGDVRERLSEFIDADQLDELCQAIEEHLSHCRDCRVEVDTRPGEGATFRVRLPIHSQLPA